MEKNLVLRDVLLMKKCKKNVKSEKKLDFYKKKDYNINIQWSFK